MARGKDEMAVVKVASIEVAEMEIKNKTDERDSGSWI
jgi:hypothetical protein